MWIMCDVDNEGYLPACLTQDRIEGRFEQRNELVVKRREASLVSHLSSFKDLSSLVSRLSSLVSHA